MNILHILCGTISGGVPSLVYELSAFQRELGHEVDLYSFRSAPSFFETSGKFENIGVRIFKARSRSRYSIKIIRDLIKILPKYDIVHVHLFPEQLYVAIAKLFINANKRPLFITTEHSTWNNRRKYPILRLLDRWFYSAYKYIVCISPQTETSLKAWLKSNHLNNRILTINNGINLDKYISAPVYSKTDLFFEIDQKLIVMVSRMEEPKDPLTLVRAISLCPSNYHCLFIGPGKLIEDIQIMSRTLKIENRIHCLGNRYDVPSILKQCDVGVLSSNWEGFGLVAIEYMAAGLPCLFSNVEGLRDVVGDVDLLFDNGDSKNLAEKIKILITNQGYRDEKISFGNERCKQFSSLLMNQKYLQLYK